jgi:hypothetical protein
MDAWIDCMTHIDDRGIGLTAISVSAGHLVALRIDDAPDFENALPINTAR